jgi:hypothetical protein
LQIEIKTSERMFINAFQDLTFSFEETFFSEEKLQRACGLDEVFKQHSSKLNKPLNLK